MFCRLLWTALTHEPRRPPFPTTGEKKILPALVSMFLITSFVPTASGLKFRQTLAKAHMKQDPTLFEVLHACLRVIPGIDNDTFYVSIGVLLFYIETDSNSPMLKNSGVKGSLFRLFCCRAIGLSTGPPLKIEDPFVWITVYSACPHHVKIFLITLLVVFPPRSTWGCVLTVLSM